MKIEVGKLYKTRDGLTARIYATHVGLHHSIHGAVMSANGGWYITAWTAFGTGSGGADDLVSELKPLRPRRQAWIGTASGGVHFVPEGGLFPLELSHATRAPWLDEPEENQ